MKEAAGEANLTVVAIILIGIVVAVATPIVRNVLTTTAGRACCINHGGTVIDGKCSGGGTLNNQSLNTIANYSICKTSKGSATTTAE